MNKEGGDFGVRRIRKEGGHYNRSQTRNKQKPKTQIEQPSQKELIGNKQVHGLKILQFIGSGFSKWYLWQVTCSANKWIRGRIACAGHQYQSWQAGREEMQCDVEARYGGNMAARTRLLATLATRLKTLHTFTKVNPFRGHF